MTEPIQTVYLANIGNSFIECGKVKVFPHTGPLAVTDVLRTDLKSHAMTEVDQWFSRQRPANERWFVGSVCSEGLREFEKWLSRRASRENRHLLSHVDFDLHVSLDFPERIGTDRLAAATAANCRRNPTGSAVVVDSGTAVTVDLVDEKGVFQGGAILPGLKLAAESLGWGTDQLPTVDIAGFDEVPPFLGKDTVQAIRVGLYWGTVGAIERIVEGMRAQLSEPSEIFLTGGGGDLIAKQLRTASRYVPTLVLEGLALAAENVCSR